MDPHPLATTHQRFFEPTWDLHLGWENARFVVLDTEATGLDVKRDHIVSYGAVGVSHFQIYLDDSFEALVPFVHNTSSVAVHGITREQAEAGLPEDEALEQFLLFLRDGVIVGHHIDHDIEMINAACRRNFGFTVRNLSVDTMGLALRLADVGALNLDHLRSDFSLDGLSRFFRVRPADRHTAAGDAFITAQIFLRLLKIAKRLSWLRLGQLTQPYEPPESAK
jgi:DNA polymerase-3 subunit epsilon